MDTSKMLWVDFRSVQDQPSSYRYLNEEWAVSRISNIDKIDSEIRRVPPALLCFEYDYPDISSLVVALVRVTQQHNILWLQVTMHYTGSMCGCETLQNLLNDISCGIKRDVLFGLDSPVQPGTKCFSFQIFHDQIGLTIDLTDIIHCDDIRVANVAGV